MPQDFTLERLLRPLDLDTFFRDTWEKQPLVVQRRDPSYYQGLFALRDVDDVIAFTRPKFQEAHVFGPQGPAGDNYVQGLLPDDQRSPAATYPGIADLRRVFDQGKTVIVTSLHERWPAVARCCRNLVEHFGCPVHVNMYLTPPRAQGFEAHFDTHEVFTLQIEGCKHWRLYAPVRGLPLPEDQMALRKEWLGGPTQEVHMEPGDLLYIPRGHVHEAFTSETLSLHLTVGVHVFRWADVLRAALTGAAFEDVRLRASLPPGQVAGGRASVPIREQFQELLQVLVKGARVDEALQRLSRDFFGKLPLLPDGHFVPCDEQVERLDLDTLLEKRPGLLCRVVEGPDGVGVAFLNQWVEGPPKIASALHFIVKTPRFAVRALPDDLTASAKLVLARRLLREGLLRVAAGGVSGNGSG